MGGRGERTNRGGEGKKLTGVGEGTNRNFQDS